MVETTIFLHDENEMLEFFRGRGSGGDLERAGYCPPGAGTGCKKKRDAGKINVNMPQRDTSGIGERVPRELIDADFAIASSFVEMAEAESHSGNEQTAARLLLNAEQILDDIRGRLLRMTPSQKEEFEPRCTKLREAIERGKTPDSGIRPESEI
jgi:hypothetical protein